MIKRFFLFFTPRLKFRPPQLVPSDNDEHIVLESSVFPPSSSGRQKNQSKFSAGFMRPRVAIPAIIVIVLGVGGYFLFWRDSEPAREIAVAKRMDIRQEVSVTGRVEPIESVDLSFEKSGRVRRVLVGVGERVSPGMILM